MVECLHLRNRQIFNKTHRRIDKILYKTQSTEELFLCNWEKIVWRMSFFARYNFKSKARYYLKKTG